MQQKNEIEQAYSEALLFVKKHYENFPVTSFLFPKKLRKHIAVIYKFARLADDIADEGNLLPDERLLRLNEFQQNLIMIENKKFPNNFWKALHNTIVEKNIETKNFHDLIHAFKQDVTKNRYKDFNELINYCSYSANPVGRIVLQLHGIRNEEAYRYSDNICTALQLTNFLQDVSVDFQKNRIYIPSDELRKFNISEQNFSEKILSVNFREMIKTQVERVNNLFDEGKGLLSFLPFRLKHQIKWTLNGGRGILEKIVKLDYDVLNQRPKFSKLELIKMIFRIDE